MKYCDNCGAEVKEEASYCSYCGNQLKEDAKETKYEFNESDQETLGTVIKVLAVIVTVLTGFFLVPLIWTIPMTVSINNTIKEKKEFSVIFIVLSFFFLSRITAILMIFYRRKFN